MTAAPPTGQCEGVIRHARVNRVGALSSAYRRLLEVQLNHRTLGNYLNLGAQRRLGHARLPTIKHDMIYAIHTAASTLALSLGLRGCAEPQHSSGTALSRNTSD